MELGNCLYIISEYGYHLGHKNILQRIQVKAIIKKKGTILRKTAIGKYQFYLKTYNRNSFP
jgi:hypothetical protein